MYMTESDIRRLNSFVAGAGFNTTTLAKAVGMSRSTLTKKRKGEVDFTKSEMQTIANLIGAKPAIIFFGE